MTQHGHSMYSARAIRGDDDGYVAFHAPRYEYLLGILARQRVSSGTRVLDIGPSRLSELIHQRFECTVDSLGFGSDEQLARGRHFAFDLNQSQNSADWRTDLAPYDVVVMAEVIEHLHTAPRLVLRFVRSLLVPGGLLVLQTPNAAGLTKRLKLLLGRHPYEAIREDCSDPGHFREYTLSELRELARQSGFRVERAATGCYFDMRFGVHTPAGNRPRPIAGALKNFVYRSLPPALRYGISMEWRAEEPRGAGLPLR
jgi:2-polyprenyl-3-methyl-5-hydroxy-6-metoxy-1,4-benzoquinol methylase